MRSEYNIGETNTKNKYNSLYLFNIIKEEYRARKSPQLQSLGILYIFSIYLYYLL